MSAPFKAPPAPSKRAVARWLEQHDWMRGICTLCGMLVLVRAKKMVAFERIFPIPGIYRLWCPACGNHVEEPTVEQLEWHE